jgi:hypothetical protein
MVVLGSTTLEICATCLAEVIATSLQSSLVNLAVGLYDVDDHAGDVCMGSDPLSSLVPTHNVASIVESLDKCGCGGRSHREPLIIGEFFAFFLVDHRT